MNFTFSPQHSLQNRFMANEDESAGVARACALMCEALLLLDAAGITLPATHLEQALPLLNEEIIVR